MEVIQRMAADANDAQTNRARWINCGPIRIDQATREVYVGRTPVLLRRAEFNVLVYLVERAPYPATQTDIVRDVLGTTGNGGSARNHVCEIRKKLRAAGVDDAVVTMAGLHAYRVRWRAKKHFTRNVAR